MKLKVIFAILFLGFSQSSFAQVETGCCFKQVPGHGGMCILHAPLPNSQGCPGGFDYTTDALIFHSCPARGAQPHQAACHSPVVSAPGTAVPATPMQSASPAAPINPSFHY